MSKHVYVAIALWAVALLSFAQKNETADITAKDYHLKEVVVTGQFIPQSIQNSIYKVKVISNQEIQQKSATDIQSLLNTELGIRLSNDMNLGETDFEIMGMGGNNVKVLLDGIPMIDRLYKKQSLNQIDINTIERIEIVEGPMSVIYGTDALAGVINIITKKGIPENGKNLSVGARIQEESIGDEYNLFDKKGIHNQSVNARYSFDNGLYISGNFARNRFGGWQGDSIGRKKQWQPKDQYLTGGQVGFRKSNYDLSYRLDYMNENLLNEADISTLTNTTSNKEYIVNRYTHQLQANWKASNSLDFAFAGSYQDYKRRIRTTNIDLTTGKETLSTNPEDQDKTTLDSWFGRVMAVWKIRNNLSFQPGIEVQSDNGFGNRMDGEHRITNTALFLSAEYTPLDWLSLRPGFRSSFNSVYDAPWATPAMNVKARITEYMDLRASYARGFRAPTLQELYYSFHDSNHDLYGNPDLKSEYSNSYQLSLTWRAIHNEQIRFTTQLTGFYNDFRDRISLIESKTQIGYSKYYNIDRYKTLGFTIENNLYWKYLRASLNFSYLGRYNKLYENESYQDEDMSQFRYSPELSASISYTWNKVATFAAYYKFTGERKEYGIAEDNTLGLLGTNSYNWADFTISRPIGKLLTIAGGIKNIFNITTIRNTAGSEEIHNQDTGVSQIGCGRSYFIGLSFNFQK
ncbi:TonB-dependent receptor plug domain-containing protein [Dysgonomonas macrotermitis]|uniref:Outer membrane receptor for ferrienterochelin and colicins n=1 Tax=Dysgonomonas macrotermitis TaxID=1346286 RepID=A0A1M5IB36_9BACT|nr:TonB-dependent receptor [Dysgonomonas macrotermitis]SHG25457.1 outer membrane receptor for ferrienterochelin and colicins [Dysgonomonas macrotermitis]